MNLKVNGRNVDIDISAGIITVSRLLDHLDIEPSRVVVEKNRVVLDRANYKTEELKEGDTIEIVHFVGGGNYTWNQEYMLP